MNGIVCQRFICEVYVPFETKGYTVFCLVCPSTSAHRTTVDAYLFDNVLPKGVEEEPKVSFDSLIRFLGDANNDFFSKIRFLTASNFFQNSLLDV